jgi:phosphate transport system substrate-binding protein
MAKKNFDVFTEKRVIPVAKPIKFLINLITVLLIIGIIVGCHVGYYLFTEQEIKPDWLAKVLNQYHEPKNQVLAPSREPIYSLFNYPKVDGSTATLPLAKAFEGNFTASDANTLDITHSKTAQSYTNLMNRSVDLILVVEPNQEKYDLATKNNVELDVTKIVNEGFVFFVNKSNPVDSLTVEQIQGIYSGDITNWSQVGGNDEAIIAYQRPKDSESQIGMETIVMKDKQLMNAPETNIESGASDISNVVSNYSNNSGAIGYSLYYYANTIYVNDEIKMLKVNGVEPNKETIKSGDYPFLTAYYAVSLKGKNEKADKLKEHMLSNRGQLVAEQAGYVPVK